jgi:hypothetical protein
VVQSYECLNLICYTPCGYQQWYLPLYTMWLSITHQQWYLPNTYKDHNQHDESDNNNAAVSMSVGLCAKAVG